MMNSAAAISAFDRNPRIRAIQELMVGKPIAGLLVEHCGPGATAAP